MQGCRQSQGTAAHPLHTYPKHTQRWAGMCPQHCVDFTASTGHETKPLTGMEVAFVEKHTNAEVNPPQTSYPWRKRPRTHERKGKTHMHSRGSFTAFKSSSGNKLTLVLGNSPSTSKALGGRAWHPSKSVTVPRPKNTPCTAPQAKQ